LLNIVGGRFRGAKLYSPKGGDARPTLGRTREAIFNVLSCRYDLQEYRAVDLFAGSGALGLEAVSRGAESAVFVENNKQNCQVISKNIKKLDVGDCCQVFSENVISWISRYNWSIDKNLFLIDPPYNTPLAQSVLESLGQMAGSLTSSLIVIEAHKSQVFKTHKCFQSFQQKKYGTTTIDFFEVLKQ